jgi:hypothetical protein
MDPMAKLCSDVEWSDSEFCPIADSSVSAELNLWVLPEESSRYGGHTDAAPKTHPISQEA